MSLFPSLTGNAVYVMRHGRTVLDDEKRSDGWLDYPLSDEGRVGLINAQQYLKFADITKVYAPDLRRAFETAHIVASGVLAKPKVIIADQAKTWNLGMLMGTKKKPNRPLVHYFMDHPDEKPLGGESLREFHNRFIPWLMDKVANKEGSILVVTSGSNLREIGSTLKNDKDIFDLDESGLMSLTNTPDGIQGQVIFGHKNEDDEWLS